MDQIRIEDCFDKIQEGGCITVVIDEKNPNWSCVQKYGECFIHSIFDNLANRIKFGKTVVLLRDVFVQFSIPYDKQTLFTRGLLTVYWDEVSELHWKMGHDFQKEEIILKLYNYKIYEGVR